jgi:cell division protein FtsA
MPGVVELAEDVFFKPVRIGVPNYTGSLAEVVRTPRHSTAMGLIQEAYSQQLRGRSRVPAGTLRQIWGRVKEWLVRNF